MNPECVGCVLKEIVILCDNFELNRNTIVEMLFKFNSLKQHERIGPDMMELENKLEAGMNREDLLCAVDILSLKSDFIYKDEVQEIQKLITKSGSSINMKKRHEKLVRDYDKTHTAKLIKN